MRRAIRLLVLLAFAGCGDGGFSFGIPGCTETSTRPFVTAPENTTDRGVRATVTAEGLKFLVDRREALARALLDVGPDGHVRVPWPEPIAIGDLEGGLGLELRDLVLDFDLRRVEVDISFLPDPARIRFELRYARLGLDEGIVAGAIGVDGACRVRNGLDPGTPEAALIDADIAFDVALVIDENGAFRADVDVLPFTVHDLGIELELDRSLPECSDGVTASECTIACNVANAASDIGEALRDAFSTQLDDLLQPFIQGFVNNFLRKFNGKPLWIEGEVRPQVLSALLPIAKDAHPFRFRVGPSPDGFGVRAHGDEADGLDLTLSPGLDADDHPCAPPADGAPVLTAGPPPALTGRDARGGTYHLGLSLAEATLNRALWVAYRSGALCLALDSETIERLTGQRVDSALLGNLLTAVGELTNGEPAPVMLVVDPDFRAAQFPLVEFQPVADDGGVPQARLDVALPGLGTSFYVLVEGRWSRVWQGRVDVEISATAQATPDNRLALALAPPTITNLQTTYDELLAAVDLPGLLQMMVDLASSGLFQDGFSLDVGLGGLVSELSGLPLDVRVVALKTEGEAGDFLSVLLSLVDARAGGAAVAAVETRAAPGRVDLPAGRAEIAVAAEGADAALFQWRVDEGPWRPLAAAPGGVLRVDDPRLRLVGPHRVHVRAVARGEYRSLDPTPAVVELETPSAAAVESGGCAAAPATSFAPWAALLLLLRRRRR